MGLLSSLKERVKAEQSFGRVAQGADIGIDVKPTPKSQGKKWVKLDRETQGGLFESKEEKRERNRKKAREIYDKIGRGYAKYEKGKKSVGKLFNDLGTLIPDQSSGGRRSKSSSNGFGISDKDLRDLQGLGGGNPFGSSSRPRRKSSGRKNQVPIYRGKRIVGYRIGGGRSKKKAKRNPWDLDLGF